MAPPRRAPNGPTPRTWGYTPRKKRLSGWKIFAIVCAAVVALLVALTLVVFFATVKPALDEANAYLGDLQHRNLAAAQQRMCNSALSEPASDLAQLDTVRWGGRYELTDVEAIRGTANFTTVRGTVGNGAAVAIVHLGDGECILGIEVRTFPTRPSPSRSTRQE